jgi:hypothetical protein
MFTSSEIETAIPRFESIPRVQVPKGHDGKHKLIMQRILSDLDRLGPGYAVKIPIAELPDVKENIRSALNRAAHRKGFQAATASDAEFLYVWKADADA